MSEKCQLKFLKSSKVKKIPAETHVKVTQMQHIVEVLSVARNCTNFNRFVKLDKYRYTEIEIDTGEIIAVHEYKLNENRGQNISGVKHTLKHIRNLINNNFLGGDN